MINNYSHVIARQLDTAVVKRLILNQWWQITIMFIVILASSSALADRVQVNKNKISDLFEKEIDDKQATLKFIENSQKQSERGISSKGAVQELGVDEKELEGKVSELNAINVNNLESKGQEERAKEENSYINQLEVDYLDPKIVNHKRDIDKISDASSKLMSRLMEGLRDLDIDCKTVKGDKELEPEYVIEIEKEHFKDTIYNQKFCEELRNRYSCVDGLTLQCLQFSEKPAELTITQSSMQYTQNIAGLVKNISFIEKYGPQPSSFIMRLFGGDGESTSCGGGRVHGFINKSSGTTYHAREATWYISFNVSTNVAMLTKIQLTDISYGTFVMFKLNGQVIFVGPAQGNNLFLNGHRSVETKGKKKYAGKFGKRITITTNYPIVNTGFGEYALGLDSIADSSRVAVINLLPHIRQGDNILEIKAIGRGQNVVSFNLDVSERICTYWQENWHEQCKLE